MPELPYKISIDAEKNHFKQSLAVRDIHQQVNWENKFILIVTKRY